MTEIKRESILKCYTDINQLNETDRMLLEEAKKAVPHRLRMVRNVLFAGWRAHDTNIDHELPNSLPHPVGQV